MSTLSIYEGLSGATDSCRFVSNLTQIVILYFLKYDIFTKKSFFIGLACHLMKNKCV